MRTSAAALLAAPGLAALAAAQHATTFVNPAVPTGTPVPGNYSGALRPQVHFSPPQHFLNDPNGMFVDARGVWHLYYQYNPTGDVAGNQHWGHATSRDLYHWENQAIALFPPEETTYVFSGSAVVDAENTSGLFPAGQDNGVVAVLTLSRTNPDGTPGPQTQNLAYSLDGGYSFEYYDGNPVIASESSQFRDPKVIRYGGGGGGGGADGPGPATWVAVVAYSHDFAVGIFTSPDLKEWTWQSNFTRHGLLGTQYECPNLVRMPVRDAAGAVVDEKYVMVISVQPGAPLGGSTTEYFIGDFNGTHFTPDDAATRLSDFAKDNYAAQFFFDGRTTNTTTTTTTTNAAADDHDDDNSSDEDPVSIGWASNWQYAQQAPTGGREGWRGAATLPRAHSLVRAPRVGLVMASEPHAGLAPVLIGAPSSSSSSSSSSGDDGSAAEAASGPLKRARIDGGSNGSLSLDYARVASGALLVDVNVTGIDTGHVTAESTLNLTLLSSSSSSELRSGFYFGGDNPFWVDRARARGLVPTDDPFFTDKFSAADVYYEGELGGGGGGHDDASASSSSWRLRAVVDRSVLEVFLGERGRQAGTVLFYPSEPLTRLELSTAALPEGCEVSVAVWALRSGWAPAEDGEGIVRGNVTAPADKSTAR